MVAMMVGDQQQQLACSCCTFAYIWVQLRNVLIDFLLYCLNSADRSDPQGYLGLCSQELIMYASRSVMTVLHSRTT